jgi:hypothetical protein
MIRWDAHTNFLIIKIQIQKGQNANNTLKHFYQVIVNINIEKL